MAERKKVSIEKAGSPLSPWELEKDGWHDATLLPRAAPLFLRSFMPLSCLTGTWKKEVYTSPSLIYSGTGQDVEKYSSPTWSPLLNSRYINYNGVLSLDQILNISSSLNQESPSYPIVTAYFPMVPLKLTFHASIPHFLRSPLKPPKCYSLLPHYFFTHCKVYTISPAFLPQGSLYLPISYYHLSPVLTLPLYEFLISAKLRLKSQWAIHHYGEWVHPG